MSRYATLYFLFICQIIGVGLMHSTVNAMPPPPNALDQQHAALANAKTSSFDSFKVSQSLTSEKTGNTTPPIKVYIAPVKLSFQEHWLRDRRTELTKSYLTNTAERYQSVFNKAAQKEFEKHNNFDIVTDATQASWIVTPTISDLIIHGPDVGPGKTSYVQRAGEAKLSVEVKDNSKNLIAIVEDRRQTRQRAIMKPEKTSRILNQRDFRYLFDDWSEDLARELGLKLEKN